MLPPWLRKLMPTIILLTLAALAGGTDVFSSTVHDFVQNTLKQRLTDFMPTAVNLLIAAICFNLAWLAHEPLKRVAEKAFERSGASERGKTLGMKVIVLVFWVVVIFTVLSMFASEFMGKFVVGFGAMGAALTFAMNGVANDFICGVLMQFTCRIREGDDIKLSGTDIEGKIGDIGYLSTSIKTSDGTTTVPNRKIWESPIKQKKAPPSKLILPDGFKRTPVEEDADGRICRKDK